MAIRKSVLMMTNTGTNWNITGEPVRADAYYGYTDGIHTVQVVYQNFVGGFGLQGTLSLNPQPEDWFWIQLNPTGDNIYPYLTYPRAPLYPTGSNGGDTGTEAFTFIGNFVYLRAVMNRDYIQAPPQMGNQSFPPGSNPYPWTNWIWGEVDKVLLSL
jgi:hypothetical protein